jgi:hypothetical protein
MRRRRILWIALALVIAGLAITAAILLRKHSPPEAARLLPETDTYLYFNVAPLRVAGALKHLPAVPREADYEQFVRETGFEFERDLDEAAFAVHPASRAGEETRYSEVFVGRVQLDRLRAYLGKLAKSVEQYRDRDIFNIPLQGRTVRVAILGVGTVAVSNVDNPLVIRGMVDRYKQIALPLGGPSLLRKYYARVPWGSLAWAVAKISTPAEGNQAMVLPGGYNLFFPGGTVVIASARYLGTVQFRADAVTPDPEAAQRLQDQLSAFVALFRAIETNTEVNGSDKDVKAFFDSLKVEREEDHVVLSATAPQGFFGKLVAEGPTTSIVPQPAPAPEKKAAPPKKKRARRR